LHEYLDGLQAKMNAIDIALRSDFAVGGLDDAPASTGASAGAASA
jgi:hypothetical protein